ncbi:MAG: PEGA domain-containing protein [Deltaproteobacteria bacterium]|nr:PEGA domain-containing protein [Deltaproteobacteria bacterium]
MRRMSIVVSAGVFVLASGLWFRSDVFRPFLAASGGTVSGKVVLLGDAPQPKKLEISKDKEKCGSDKTAEDLVVSSDKGIKNAVVSVAGVKGKVDKAPVLDQKGCVFTPHVVLVSPGTPLDVLNNDGILHNFHTYSSKNPAVNKAQPGFKKKMTESFAQPEIIKVNCDAHAWMTGWIVVTDNLSTVTIDGGSFKLSDVPAGTHKLEIWHETLGKVTKDITVKAGEETKLTIELAKK